MDYNELYNHFIVKLLFSQTHQGGNTPELDREAKHTVRLFSAANGQFYDES